ncbi:MAG: universal stress protein [Actinobacteria bacterium]|nr:universal stress protein [Actinomycetota bacterium]
MTVLISYVPTPEGWPVLATGIREARLRDTSVALLNIALDHDCADDTFADDKDLDPVRDELSAAGLRYTILRDLDADNVADAILAAADRANAELIVMGHRPRSPLAAALPIDTVRRVLAGARCPVLTVPPRTDA